jgi:hypothetical protein
MTFSVHLEPCEGQFAATLVGAPEVRAVATTRDEAISALKGQITQRVVQGELFSVEVGPIGVAELAGKYAADPSLRQICFEAYENRDAKASG